MIDRAALAYADKPAFSDDVDAVTFRDVRDAALGVAAFLTAGGARPRQPVAVMTTHSAADICAFAGCLYAGCFYAPVDAAAPAEHIKARLAALSPAAVIDAKRVADLPAARVNEAALAAVRREIIGHDPAYAIFTSGSTGAPKAALIPHAAVLNLTRWLSGLFGFTANTVFAGQAPFYFDSSVQEIYAAFHTGATVRLFPRKLFISPLAVMRRVEEVGANVLPWAAAAVKLLAASGVLGKLAPDCVTDVIFGGENMPGKTLNIWRGAMPNARFANVYGPSETTVDCSCYIVNRPIDDGESVPIGQACANGRLLLLDKGGQPVPQGEAGEIYVCGAGVGLGYYGDAARTAAAFVQNPTHSLYRDIVYKTGDIARYNERGELVYLSRADGQVKHMGGRVELGEVEAAASAVDGVDIAFCGYDKERGRILLFYEGRADESGVAAAMAANLPRYMCPGFIRRAESLPRLSNGKIDRIAARGALYDEVDGV